MSNTTGNEYIAKQEFFVLTRDMAPIHINEFNLHGCCFVCPLPKGFAGKIPKILSQIREKSKIFIEDINLKAKKSETPFENILLGYHERTDEQKQDLLKNFKIVNVGIDNRGVYGVQAGDNINSGDVYLSSDEYNWHMSGLHAIEHFFEPKACWHCHNIDHYWQAVLTREFCVIYFNWLNNQIYNKNSFYQTKL